MGGQEHVRSFQESAARDAQTKSQVKILSTVYAVADIDPGTYTTQNKDWMMHENGACVNPGCLAVWILRTKVDTKVERHPNDEETSQTESPEELK